LAELVDGPDGIDNGPHGARSTVWEQATQRESPRKRTPDAALRRILQWSLLDDTVIANAKQLPCLSGAQE